MNRSIVLVFILGILINTNICDLNSQTIYKNIIHYSINDGLSSGLVQDIAQDSLGYIWIATKAGLNKFDGYNFKVYNANIDDSSSILSNELEVIFVDETGVLWVGYRNNGISKYSRETDSFTHYQISKNKDGKYVRVLKILSGNGNSIWVASLFEIIKINTETKEWKSIIKISGTNFINDANTIDKLLQERIPDTLVKKIMSLKELFYPNDSVAKIKLKEVIGIRNYHVYGERIFNIIKSSRPRNIRNFTKDNSGNYYFAIADSRLFKINSENNKTTLFYQDPSINRNFIQNRLLEFYDNKIWHSKARLKDLKITDLKTLQTFDIHKLIEPENLYPGLLKSIDFDHEGNIWGMFGEIYYIDLKEKEIFNIRHNQVSCPLVTTKLANKVIVDRNQNVWATTNKKGVLFIAKKSNFHRIELKADTEQRQSNIRIAAINIDSKGNLWVLDKADGIYIIDEKNNKIKREFLNKTPYPFASTSTFFEDKMGNIWLGTYTNGIYIYNPLTDNISPAFSKNIFKLFTNKKVFSITQDNENNIWIGTNFTGLSKYQPDNNEMINLKTDPDYPIKCNSSYVYKIFIDSRRSMWIIGADKLRVLHAGQTNFKTFNELTNGQLNEIFEVVDIIEASDSNIWLATSNGLVMIEAVSDSVTVHKLVNSQMKSIIEDDAGNLWIGSGNGLYSFNTSTCEYIKYTVRDGIPSNNFERRSVAKANDGTLYFGTDNGLMHFKPEDIFSLSNLYDPVITKLRLFNEIVNVGDEIMGRVILDKSIEVLDEITFHHNENDFSLEFADFHYEAPERCRYHYMLEGFDKTWKTTDHLNRRANYTNLPPGKYLFKLYLSVPNNERSNYKYLTINIQPAWWNTTVFRILAILVLIIGIYGFIQLRLALIKKQKAELEEAVRNRTKEVNEKNKLLEVQAIDLKKTNIILKKQSNDLITQAKHLNEINTQLEERQQQIEEQSEELKNQADYLHEVNIRLEERQQKVEEQSSQLIHQSAILEQKNFDLNVLNKTKDKLFSIIAHDLKNPFGAVLGYAELLLNNMSTLNEDKKIKFIETIHKSAENAHKLLENLLEWSRSQIGQKQYNPEYFIISEVIAISVDFMEQMITDKRINCKYDNHQEIEIFADRNMIETVFRNLLANALKYTPENGTITIKSTVKKDSIEVSVTDSGIGMDQETIDKLFSIDKITSQSGTLGETGTGLGLILCKEFIDKHQGKLWAESEIEKGSTVTFSIPQNIKSTLQDINQI